MVVKARGGDWVAAKKKKINNNNGETLASPAAGGRCSAARRGGGKRVSALPGTEGPSPRCGSAQGGSVSVATVASEDGFRKQQADCQFVCRAEKSVAQIETAPTLRIRSARLRDYRATRSLRVKGHFLFFFPVFSLSESGLQSLKGCGQVLRCV